VERLKERRATSDNNGVPQLFAKQTSRPTGEKTLRNSERSSMHRVPQKGSAVCHFLLDLKTASREQVLAQACVAVQTMLISTSHGNMPIMPQNGHTARQMSHVLREAGSSHNTAALRVQVADKAFTLSTCQFKNIFKPDERPMRCNSSQHMTAAL
jgi:hypothetical protein